MNSSISSFRNELKVFAVVLALVGGLEIFERVPFAGSGSDSALLREFPALADDLAQEPGTHMILLGNSLTQNGYDMPLLQADFDGQTGGTLRVRKVALAGSNPIEWYHVFDRNFVARGKMPEIVVINMSPSGISDELPAGYRIGWLARETRWRDVPEVLFADLKSIDVGGQYLQARVSPLYANRWDLRADLLAQIIPNAWDGMKWINAGQPAPPAKPGQARPPRTYSLLRRLLNLIAAGHGRAILVAMPAREGYSVDPQLLDILKRRGVTFLDCRSVPGLSADGFEDGWHLNPQGAQLFTAYVSQRLSRAAQPSPSSARPK